GDLVYHMVIGSALLLIFLVALPDRRQAARSSAQNHVRIGAGLLLAFHLLLAIITKLVIPAGLHSSMTAVTIEFLINSLTLLWLIWSFIDRDETFLITGSAIFISLALLLWSAVSLVMLHLQPEFLPDENDWMLAIWDLGSIALSALGVAILWLKRPQGWTVGTSILLMLGLGHALPFLFAEPDIVQPGTIRLAQVLALPWAIILTQRFKTRSDEEGRASGQDERADVTTLLVEELLKISRLENANEKYLSIARALSLSVVADMCFLIRHDGAKGMIVCLAGYDLIREQPLSIPSLHREDLPNIIQAWESSHPFSPSYPPLETKDAATLREVLKCYRIGNVLAYPLGTASRPLNGGVIFLSPHTDKRFGKHEKTLMAKIEDVLAQVLFEPGPVEKLTAELEAVNQQAGKLQKNAETLSQRLSDSETTIADQESQIKQLKAKYQIEKLKMIMEINACQDKIFRLSSQASSHKQDMAKLEELRARIRELITERERLEGELASANSRIEALESQLSTPLTTQAIIKNEIISLAALTANIKLSFGPRCQRQGLRLNIDNPEGHQLIKTDPEKLQNLIDNLLENALLASKPESTLHFELNLSYETGMLQLQVTDYGAGLSNEEQRTLFNEQEEPPAGIGSLESILEAVRLVQALNGKVWLRSKQDAFTSFRVQLPVRIMD
ncbi:MAG: ATP-binding protein, partial [Brevefilum sp.]